MKEAEKKRKQGCGFKCTDDDFATASRWREDWAMDDIAKCSICKQKLQDGEEYLKFYDFNICMKCAKEAIRIYEEGFE